MTLILSILGYLGNYLYNLALNPRTSKSRLFKNDHQTQTEPDKINDTIMKEAKAWFHTKSNYKEVYLRSHDNLELHSYELRHPKSTSIWVICVHGYMSQGDILCCAAKCFYEKGYNILIPDLRGHGKSKGDYIGMGWHDRKDIIGWIHYILRQDSEAEIVLYGISMGAATVMMVSGESLPPNVKVVIEDCGYTSVWAQFTHHLHKLFKLPPFPFLHIASLVTKIRAGYWLSEASALKQISKSHTPTLFIHGDEDTFVPYSMLEELYQAASCEKEKLIIKGASHGKSAACSPTLYWFTIEKFLTKHLPGSPS